MKKLVVANLKMNMDYEMTLEYVKQVNKNIVICPSYIFIPFFINKTLVGAQNCSMYEKGSYTGEVSALHLKQLGVDYVIIGHSECRKNDSDEIINQKIKMALKNHLKVILCIGENKDDNRELKLLKQLKEDLIDVDLTNIIIAYEPIWAIGTNVIPTNQEIEMASKLIKDYIKNNYEKDVLVLYGGSVDLSNIDELKEVQNIDGFLVGRASTDYKQINAIYNTVNT